MSVVPWPMGTARGEGRASRMSYRAPMVHPDRMHDELRHRAEIEAAFSRGDNAITQLEARLKAVEIENAELRSRVDALESAP